MKVLNTVIIGYGEIASSISLDKKITESLQYASHTQALKDSSEFCVVAIVDPSEEARKLAHRDWPDALIASNCNKLPDEFEIDVAVITTKPESRIDVLLEMPKSIRGVIVEKPLGLRLGEILEFQKTCKKLNLIVQVNLQRRMDLESRKILGDWWEDNIGGIQHVNVLYGKGLFNNGIHAIDYVRMMCGEITSAQAIGEITPFSSTTIKSDFNATAILMLEQSAPVYMRCIDFRFYRDIVIDIWGTKGRLEVFQEGLLFNYYPLAAHRAMAHEQEIQLDNPTKFKAGASEALLHIYNDFYSAMVYETKLHSSLDNAVQNHKVIDAIIASSSSGKSCSIAN
tara:strand:+ start:7216 stop:8235 length:1020 start_codon:yes stop_codon:yes gene_type:complete